MKHKILRTLSKLKFFIIILNILYGVSAFAGNQSEEDLKDDTRNLLSRAISDNAPSFNSFSNIKEEYLWLVTFSQTLRKRLPDNVEREGFLRSVHYEASRAGLDPVLVLGLIKIESNFEKYAISSVGAKGYMQVMPFWVNAIGGNQHNLFHLRTNLRYGCTILRHYLDRENGNMFMALGRYNGSRGQEKYPNLVLDATMEFKRKIK